MADDRKAFQSPIGIAYFPSLNRTETYKGKETGNYSLKLILETPSRRWGVLWDRPVVVAGSSE
jgi:hypothetical protein